MTFQDHFSRQAAAYARFRPIYPRELYAWIASIAPARRLAWDCATGNGQAALGMAEHFDRVIATDPSSAQLTEAQPHERVTYEIAAAEETNLATASVDAITVASAAHWFDLDRFYAEAHRVLVPGGAIAIWCYHNSMIDPDIDQIILRFARDVIGPYWSSKINLVNEHYRSIPFPFEEVAHPPFMIESEWSAEEMLGYLHTWSATQAYMVEWGDDPLEKIAEDLRAAWGAPGSRRKVQWELYLRAGHKR